MTVIVATLAITIVVIVIVVDVVATASLFRFRRAAQLAYIQIRSWSMERLTLLPMNSAKDPMSASTLALSRAFR